MARYDRQRAKNFFQRQGNADDARGADKQFLRRAAKPLRRFGDRALGGGMASRAGGAVRVARVHNHGAHAAFRLAQVFLGNENGCGNDEILREHGGGRGRGVARKNREIERAGFLQAARGRGKAEPARQGCFRKCVLYQRNVRVASAPLPEGTSDPPQRQRGRIVVSLLGLHSWLGSCFGGFLVETCFQIGNGGAHVFGRGAAVNFFRRERGVNAEALREIGFKGRRDLFQSFERKSRPRNILFLGLAQHFADDVVRLAEGNAFVHEIVRGFGGKQGGIGRRNFQSVSVELRGSDSARRNREHVRDLIVRGEEGFFVFLEVALVTGGQALQCCEKTKQRTGDAAGLAADQFPGVGIFLLGHEAAAGGVFVGKNYVRKFLRRKNHEVFRESRKMRRDPRERKKIIEREVAIADGVETVRGHAGKSKLARNRVAINRERISRERARTHRTRVRAGRRVFQACDIARERFGMRKEEMRKQNRLCVLHVRHARHGHAEIRFRLQQKRVQQGFEAALNFRSGIDDE